MIKRRFAKFPRMENGFTLRLEPGMEELLLVMVQEITGLEYWDQYSEFPQIQITPGISRDLQ